jgi:hypothetical protein
MDFILRQIAVSFLLLIIGLLIYFMLAYIIELPGRETIEQKFMSEGEKKKKKKISKTIGKIYTVILIAIIVIFNLITFITTKR